MKLPRLQAAIIRTLIVLLVVFIPYLFSRVMSPFRVVEQRAFEDAPPVEPIGETLKIAAYNIAHGRGTASSNADGGNKEEREQRLRDIAELLKQIDADVLVLNEVDFDSSWSFGVNQAEFLARAGGYPYWVEQRNLDFRFLWKTWRFGNAILSKIPLTEPYLIQLPAYTFWEPLLAGKKQAVSAVLEFDGQKARILAAHLTHRSAALRMESAKRILDYVSADDLPTLLAGDLNSMPLSMVEPEANDVPPNAIQVFGDSGQFKFPTVSIPLRKAEMTFHSEDPKWMIDWILIPPAWQFKTFTVAQGTLSDHRLIHAEISPLASQN